MKRFIILMVWASLLAAGCSPAKYTPVDVTHYVWPQPPQRPRVRMLGYVASDLDVRVQTSQELLFGTQDVFIFKKPHRAVRDRAGRLYVSDTVRRAVYVVDYEAGEIRELYTPRGWGQPGGLALDEENGLLAATSGSSIYLFDLKEQKFMRVIGAGLFQRPANLVFDPARKILYVSDPRLNVVKALDYNGRPVRQIASPGGKPGQVYWPGGMDVDAEGNLYVVDTMNFRIQIFAADGSFKGTFGTHGTVPGTFARPKDVALSRDGLILVTDAAFSNVQIFDREGNVYLFVGGGGHTLNKFVLPQGIYVDEEDRFYVVDQVKATIKIFQLYSDRWYDEHPEEAAKYPAPAGRPAPQVDVGGPAPAAASDTGAGVEAPPEGVAETEAEKPAYDPEELKSGW